MYEIIPNAICTPLWECQEGHWVSVGFLTQEVLGWTFLKDGPCPVLRTGPRPGANIYLDQWGNVDVPSGKRFRCIADALIWLNQESG
jgi:hypothetical protein